MRRARLAAAAVLGTALAAAAWVAVADGLRDRRSLADAERAVGAAWESLRGRDPAQAIALLRDAGALTAAVDAPPAWRHAWARSGERGRRDRLGAALTAAVAEAAQLLESRSAFLAAVQRLLDRVERATRVAELDDAASDARGLEAFASRDADALQRLEAALGRRREAFEADARRNEAAVARLAATVDRASSPAELQAIIDAVLPAPPRRAEDAPLAGIRRRAADARAALLAARLRSLEREAAAALDAAVARALSERADADADLDRPGTDELRVRAVALRRALRERAEALEAWERTLRDGVAAAERGAWADAHAASAALLADEPAWERAAPGIGATVAAARARLDAGADRGLYEALLRTPNLESARRYLEGAGRHVRSMADPVRSWVASAEAAALEFELVGIRWGVTGAPPPGRGLEDRPDAEVEVRVEDAPWMRAAFADVVEGTESPAPTGARSEWRAADSQLVRIGARIRIDLRDAIAADPVAIAAVAAPAGAFAGMRTVTLSARDPEWQGPPHEVRLRVRYAGVPELPAHSSAAGR